MEFSHFRFHIKFKKTFVMSNENSVVVFSCQIQPQHCHGIGNSANSVSCQIQPQHCHVSGNSAISVQPGSFSCQTHNKPASCNEISAIFTSMSNRPDSNFAHSWIRTPMQNFYWPLPQALIQRNNSSQQSFLLWYNLRKQPHLNCKRSQKSSGWPTSYMVCKPKFLYRFFAHLYRWFLHVKPV